MSDSKKPVVATGSQVDQFLKTVAKMPTKADRSAMSRLLFGMDATASREMTWDRACHLQGQMFETTSHIGTLNVQLCYYRGFNQFRASPWCTSATQLHEEMSAVHCLGGYTQIRKVLEHALAEHKTNRLRAVVFVGDALEEDADMLCHLAGQLGVLHIPLFMFQEGTNRKVKSTFEQMALLTGGAYAPFDLNSASELNDLLSAVAVYATGGQSALENFGKRRKGQVGLLTRQLKS
jgi:hypothetical protein